MGKHTHRKRLLKGPKINSRHSTVIGPAEKVVVAAKLMPEVFRIVIGKISNKGGKGKTRLLFKSIPAGLHLKVIGLRQVQEFYLYTDSPASAERILTQELGL